MTASMRRTRSPRSSVPLGADQFERRARLRAERAKSPFELRPRVARIVEGQPVVSCPRTKNEPRGWREQVLSEQAHHAQVIDTAAHVVLPLAARWNDRGQIVDGEPEQIGIVEYEVALQRAAVPLIGSNFQQLPASRHRLTHCRQSHVFSCRL